MNEIALHTFCKKLERKDKNVLFTNGCFDLFHYGHLELLADARSRADIVIVGLNSDESIKKIKGKYRPIISEFQRFRIVYSIIYVDYVITFDDKTPIKLIKKIKPDILMKGGDYKEDEVIGADIVKSYGGEIIISPLVPGISTSQIMTKIKLYDLHTKFT